MARKYRKYRKYAYGPTNPYRIELERILKYKDLGKLRQAEKDHESAVSELNKKLEKINKITDAEAEIWIGKFNYLFQQTENAYRHACSPDLNHPPRPKEGLLRSVFNGQEMDEYQRIVNAKQRESELRLKKLESLVASFVPHFEKLRSNLLYEYGTELWTYTLRTSKAGHSNALLHRPFLNFLERKDWIENPRELDSTVEAVCGDKTSDLERIKSPSEFRKILIKSLDWDLGMSEKSGIEKNLGFIRSRIRIIESSPVNLREAKAKAIIAREEGRSRNIAKSVKDTLEITKNCPYCDKSLGDNYHADHIIAVTLGGHSIKNNMVNVCAQCNREKGGDTLLNFCQKKDFDFMTIALRLQSMGKQV
ncbi:HNH endonuclease [Akkermansiaceae bacterium]|nr:HNH endonuclease [Akkermansiaceae bacterium]